MKTCTIIGGVNGAGKTSLTGVLRAERDDLGRIIDVDKLAAVHGGGIEGGKAAIRAQKRCMAAGMSFTQETTLSGRRPLRLIHQAREAGYRIRLFYVAVGTSQEALRRIANRVAKGGHDIPREDVLRRFRTRFQALARILDYCDEAVLYDNENGFVAVAEYKNGSLVMMDDFRPPWLDELAQLLYAR